MVGCLLVAVACSVAFQAKATDPAEVWEKLQQAEKEARERDARIEQERKEQAERAAATKRVLDQMEADKKRIEEQLKTYQQH
jgi:cell division protein FtsN